MRSSARQESLGILLSTRMMMIVTPVSIVVVIGGMMVMVALMICHVVNIQYSQFKFNSIKITQFNVIHPKEKGRFSPLSKGRQNTKLCNDFCFVEYCSLWLYCHCVMDDKLCFYASLLPSFNASLLSASLFMPPISKAESAMMKILSCSCVSSFLLCTPVLYVYTANYLGYMQS
jgi:hypothetical protein